MRMEAEAQVTSLQNAFHVELLKIPKSVRTMSLRDFSQQYGEVRGCQMGWPRGWTSPVEHSFCPCGHSQDIRNVMRSTVEEVTSRALRGAQLPASGATGTVVKAPRPAKTDR
jgi:hypothetical protein